MPSGSRASLPAAAALALALALAACDDEPGPPPAPTPVVLPPAALLDPQTCAPCHPDHVRQWSGSMHAYAARDPVFLAMNARGQRETGGALGDFCIRCHAPLAVLAGATADGQNLDEVPPELLGITCAYCHSIDAVEGDHGAALRVATDGVIRGGVEAPIPSELHASAWSPLHDRDRLESSGLCGSCHDVVTPGGVHLERTYAEWRSTLYARPGSPDALTCNACHMEGRDAPAADVPGAPVRRVHDHSFAAVDLALTEFPARDAQRAAVQRALDTTLLATLCVGGTGARLTLENVGAGHAFPSGAAQDRRAWVELVAYAGDRVIFETGVVGEGEPLDPAADPDLWLLGDRMRDPEGREVHMFWEVATVEGELLPGPTARDPTDPLWTETHRYRNFPFPEAPDRVTARVRLRPIDLAVIDALVASGDLDAAHRASLPTFSLAATELEWRADRDGLCVP